nr:hypothetical protein SPACI_02600 [Sporomusa acidovorans DSM 3132]
MVDIVDNADSKAVLGLVGFQIFKNTVNMAGDDIFTANTTASANNNRLPLFAVEGVFDVQVQRLRQRTHFFGSVQYGNFLYSSRNVFKKVLQRKRPIEMYGQQAYFFAPGIEVIDYFFNGLTHRAHGNNHARCIRGAMIVEQMVFPAGQFADFSHIAFDDCRQFLMITVRYFPLLKMDVYALHGAFGQRMVGVKRPFSEDIDSFPVQQFIQFFVFQHFNFLHFVRGSKPVKEIEKRHPAFNG